MIKRYTINPCKGMSINISKGQTITIIDVEGDQVVDFFAEIKDNPDEFISTGVTID